ncbi:MAG: hypothetical protein UZ22_OP11002000113 [Microgenomates bacterium OLB23]|nr:MAG: hypothetical protein UZ22_OP11002000113 [Microgenomates bacterium OLB23]
MFKGSIRQARGELLKLLLQGEPINSKLSDKRYKNALDKLIDEGFVVKDGKDTYSVKK